MFAVIKTGGKQYRVAQNDLLTVEKLDGEAGDTLALGDVMLVSDGDDVIVGAPLIAGAQVAVEIVSQGKGDKVLVMKKKRRNTYRRKRGHRQLETVLRVVEILPKGGFKAAGKAKPAPAKATTDTVASDAVVAEAATEKPARRTRAAAAAEPITPVEATAPDTTAEAAPKPKRTRTKKDDGAEG